MRIARGNTLIELLVAMMVIFVGLFTAATLVYGNLALVQRDTDQVTAMNLAREGIELAKQLRDSNWLGGKNFDDGMFNLNDVTDYTGTPHWFGNDMPSFQFTANSLGDGDTIVLALTDPGTPEFYANQTLQPPIIGTPTPFQRLVTFHPICGDETHVLDSGLNCSSIQVDTPKIGVRVESHVSWVRKGKQNDTMIFTDLYDWR